MGERTSGIEGKIQDIDTLVKENAKSKRKEKKNKSKAKQNKQINKIPPGTIY